MKKKKKILVFVNNRYLPEHNGAAVFFHNTAKHLSKKNFNIVVNRICRASEFKKDYKIDNILVKSLKIPNLIFDSKLMNYFYFFLSFFIQNIFNKSKYHAIHCITITWHTLIIIFISKLINKEKKIIIDHTLNTDLKVYSGFKSRFLNNVKKHILFKADIIRALSPFLKNQLKIIGLKNHQLYLPNIDFKHFKIASKKYKKKLRSKLNISHNKFIILSVGRVSYRKGSDILIKAFNQINKKRKFQLILLGPCEKEFKKYKNLDGIFISDKKIDNVNEYMQAADLFAMISRNEGLGIVYIEALASGLKVLMPKIRGISDYIINQNFIGKETTYKINDIKKHLENFHKYRKNENKKACRDRAFQIIKSNNLIRNLESNWC